MTDYNLNVDAGGVRLKITGLRETLKALNDIGAETEDMRDLMHDVGMVVVRHAKARAPRGDTQKLVRSLRAGRGKTKAVVRAGGARIPYAGVIHYGTREAVRANKKLRGDYTRNAFIVDALQATHGEVLRTLNRGINDIITKYNT